MFGKHKNHTVDSIENGYIFIKKKIDTLMNEGILNMNNVQNRLIEVGHCKMIMMEKQKSLLNELDNVFEELIITLKKRKNELKGLLIVYNKLYN